MDRTGYTVLNSGFARSKSGGAKWRAGPDFLEAELDDPPEYVARTGTWFCSSEGGEVAAAAIALDLR